MVISRLSGLLRRPQSRNVVGCIQNFEQKRCLNVVAGPPRFPMTPATKILLGVGTIIIWMIIPFYSLHMTPSWAEKAHSPPEEEEEEEEPPVVAEQPPPPPPPPPEKEPEKPAEGDGHKDDKQCPPENK